MAFSIDVRLPLEKPPVFPRQCVVCGAPDPEAWFVVSSRGLWQAGGNLLNTARRLLGKKTRVEAPVCNGCLRRVRAQRLRRRILRFLLVAVIGATIAGAMKWLGPSPWRDWLGGDIVLAAALVFVLVVVLPIEYLLPVAFDIAVHAKEIAYEFQDRRYAEEFARLNGVQVDD